MDPSIVFRKTSKGLAEIDLDALELGTEARQLLILIDGARTIGDLGLLMPSLPDVGSVLRKLLMEGLITTSSREASAPRPTAPAESPAAAPAAPPPEPAVSAPTQVQPPADMVDAPTGQLAGHSPAAAGGSKPNLENDTLASKSEDLGLKLQDLQSRILREVREVFDRDADLIAPKIRACKNVAELTILATRLRDVATSYADRETADRFLARIREILSVYG